MEERVLDRPIWITERVPAETDAALVRAARANSQAFGALYDRYVDTIYRYLYRQTGAREIAEDLGQSHLNSLSRHNGPRWIGMMRLIRPNISQLAHMNPQLQFYVEQQRDSRDITVARRPAFRPLDAQIIMRLPWPRT